MDITALCCISLNEQVLYGFKMWHPFWCWKILIYSDLLCQLNWEKGCYISGIRAGLSVCWSVRLVCRVVVSVIVWQLNTVKVVCSLVRDRCVRHYHCFLVFLILCLQGLEWDKWGRSWYFSELLQVWSVGSVCRWLQDGECWLDSVVPDSRGNAEVRFMSIKDLVLRWLCTQDARMLL